jgi:LPS sulfotransferase NodH
MNLSGESWTTSIAGNKGSNAILFVFTLIMEIQKENKTYKQSWSLWLWASGVESFIASNTILWRAFISHPRVAIEKIRLL